MLRILIVDDEKTHRSALIKMLYTFYPEDIFLEAEGGEQALEAMEILDYDIVITDIRMNGMSGLALLKEIHSRYENVASIILSGYREFSYAKEAIHYGASDYLLKPVDREEVKRCLDKVRADVISQHADRKIRIDMKSQLQETADVYLEHLMQRFVLDKNFDQKNRIRELLPIESEGYFFLCQVDSRGHGFSPREFCMALKQAVQRVSIYCFTQSENLFGVLVMQGHLGDKQWFEGIACSLTDIFPGFSFSFYLGEVHQNIYQESVEAYAEALCVWQYSFYDFGRYCNFRSICERIQGDIAETDTLLLPLTEKIKKNDIIAAFGLIKKYLTENCSLKYPEPKILCRAIMLLLFRVVKALEPMLVNDIHNEMDQMLTGVHEAKSIKNLQEVVYHFLLMIGKEVGFQRETRGDDVFEHCKEYLASNYADEITMEQMAEKYYFASAYFSTLFKSHFGKSFSVYLTEIRMQKAKELLLENKSPKRVKDIARRVGYKDSNYFIRAFKKFYGYTPEEYRRMAARD